MPDLRTMSTGDLLDRTVRMYRHHLRPMLLILLVPSLGMFPFEAWLALKYGFWIRVQIGLDPLAVPLFTLFLLISNSVYVVGGAALIHFLAERCLSRPSGVWSSYRRTLGSALTISWISFLVSLLWCGPVAMVSAIGLTRMIYGGTWWWYYLSFTGVHLIIVVIGALLGLFRLSLAPLIVVIENASWVRALSRSWSLMRHNTWRAVVVSIFAGAASWAVTFAFWIPAYVVEAWRPESFQGIWGTALLQFTEWVSSPFYTIAFVLLYFDILIRREGFDLDVMASNLNISGAAADTVAKV